MTAGPTASGVEPRGARLSTDDGTVITVASGAAVLFEVNVENRLPLTAAGLQPKRFRLGVRLLTAEGAYVRELAGCFIPPDAARPEGRATASLKRFFSDEPGDYQLLVDVVDDVDGYWFSDRGSQPLMYQVTIE